MSQISDFSFDELDNVDIEEGDPFRNELSIDKYNLDDEWKRQPYLTFKWTALVAEAERRMDKAKTEREITRSNLDAAIRKSPTKYGLETKMTESAIQGIIITSNEFKEAEEKYVEAKRRYGIVVAASRGIGDKKAALENIVKLFLNNYYAEPYVPKEMHEKVQEQARDEQIDQLNNSPRLIGRNRRIIE
jgi:hypothetical protein